MVNSLASIEFALGVTAPICVVIAIGALLAKIEFIKEDFINTGSKLVFNITLPALLFVSIVSADIHLDKSVSLVAFGVISTIIVYLLLEIFIPKIVKVPSDRGVVIQGSFRSNMGIVGLAYCVNAYGDAAFPAAAIFLAFVTITYNVLAIITLTRWGQSEKNNAGGVSQFFKALATNPLIMAITAALTINALSIPLPDFAIQSGKYFAQMTLPVALLCAGASLNLKINNEFGSAVIASVAKLLIIPTAITTGAYLLGFNGVELGIIFLMTCAPSASVTFVMTKVLGGNSTLAANIIVITTIFSLITTSIGTAILRQYQLM